MRELRRSLFTEKYNAVSTASRSPITRPKAIRCQDRTEGEMLALAAPAGKGRDENNDRHLADNWND